MGTSQEGTPVYTGHQDMRELDKLVFETSYRMYLEDLSKKNDENKMEKISMFGCPHMRYGIYIRLSPLYHGVRNVYHGVRKVYHGVRKVYHGVTALLQFQTCLFLSLISAYERRPQPQPPKYRAIQIFLCWTGRSGKIWSEAVQLLSV